MRCEMWLKTLALEEKNLFSTAWIIFSSLLLLKHHLNMCKGENTIIKKVSVNADKGKYIIDQVMTGNDFGDCSNQTLRTIKFDVKDSKGNHTNLHGKHLSFSIIFSRLDKSI